MNFIIKSGLIRGKPSCAATWTKSFASAEIADSRQILDFQILDPSICAAQTLSHTLNLFSVVQMENLQNHPSWPYVSAAVPMVAPSEGVDDRIRKMGRQQILLSIGHAALGTLRVSGKMGVSCLLRSITSAFQGLGLVGGEASLTMGTPGHTPESRKLGTGAASSGRSQDSRAGAPVIPTPGPSSRPDLDPSRACLPPAM